MKNKKIWAWILIIIGFLIIISTHIFMIVKGLPNAMILLHAIANLIAAILVFIGALLKP